MTRTAAAVALTLALLLCDERAAQALPPPIPHHPTLWGDEARALVDALLPGAPKSPAARGIKRPVRNVCWLGITRVKCKRRAGVEHCTVRGWPDTDLVHLTAAQSETLARTLRGLAQARYRDRPDIEAGSIQCEPAPRLSLDEIPGDERDAARKQPACWFEDFSSFEPHRPRRQ